MNLEPEKSGVVMLERTNVVKKTNTILEVPIDKIMCPHIGSLRMPLVERVQLILKSPIGDLIQKALGHSPVLVQMTMKAVNSLELIGCDQLSFIIGDKLSEYPICFHIYIYIYTHTHIKLSHFAVQKKLTQHYKSTIHQ